MDDKSINEIKTTCTGYKLTLWRARRAISSLIAICELIQPGLEKARQSDTGYFELGNDAQEIIEKRDDAISSVSKVIDALENLAMDIENETNNLGQVIADINTVIERVAVDNNQAINGVSVDRKQGGR